MPELLPFRLTRQLAGPLLPHAAHTVLHQPCCAALAALRDGRDILEVMILMTQLALVYRMLDLHAAQRSLSLWLSFVVAILS